MEIAQGGGEILPKVCQKFRQNCAKILQVKNFTKVKHYGTCNTENHHLQANRPIISVAATKLSSKFHAKVSFRGTVCINDFVRSRPTRIIRFWKIVESFVKISPEILGKFSHNLHKIEHAAVKIAEVFRTPNIQWYYHNLGKK